MARAQLHGRPVPVYRYDAIRRQLDQPTVRVIGDVPEFLHPHAAPPDLFWGTPVDRHQMRELLRSLPQPVRALCAIVAVARVLPVWESWAVTQSHLKLDAAAPRRCLQLAHEWAMGNRTVTLRTCFDAARSARAGIRAAEHEDTARSVAVVEGIDPDVEGAERVCIAVCAARSAVRLAETVADSSDPAAASSRATDVVLEAARAACPDVAGLRASVQKPVVWPNDELTDDEEQARIEHAHAIHRFVDRWWTRCRCMLAVAHVTRIAFDPPVLPGDPGDSSDSVGRAPTANASAGFACASGSDVEDEARDPRPSTTHRPAR